MCKVGLMNPRVAKQRRARHGNGIPVLGCESRGGQYHLHSRGASAGIVDLLKLFETDPGIIVLPYTLASIIRSDGALN